MVYYGLVLIAVVMFGGQFFFNGMYQKQCGSSARSSLIFTFFTSLIGSVALFITNGFSLRTTPFTILMALLMAINAMLFSFFAIKSLGITNLSLFSVFSMIGGMALPFVAGILFYDEKLTVAKTICFLLIAISIAFTADKNDKAGGWIYYLGIFVCNGMAGVLSMIFNNADREKASAADISVLSAIFRIIISGVILIIFSARKDRHEKFEFTPKTCISLALYGILSIAANYLLLIALGFIPGSMQYPLVSGGVMIVSTVIGFFDVKKPKKKDVISVAIAFLGMLALLLKI